MLGGTCWLSVLVSVFGRKSCFNFGGSYGFGWMCYVTFGLLSVSAESKTSAFGWPLIKTMTKSVWYYESVFSCVCWCHSVIIQYDTMHTSISVCCGNRQTTCCHLTLYTRAVSRPARIRFFVVYVTTGDFCLTGIFPELLRFSQIHKSEVCRLLPLHFFVQIRSAITTDSVK